MTFEPTGAFHEVALDDLFFSTTDSKGVIEQANQVFVEMARLDRDDLIGAPHNLIRHPDMPGGVFRLMWETIGARRAFSGYVFNLAGDGSSYWALATVSPLGKGYISVRARPIDLGIRDAVHTVYEAAREAEVQAMAEGESAGRAARIGEEVILAELEKLGYPSYEAFQNAFLPRELELRFQAGVTIPTRPSAKGGARALLDAGTAIEGQVRNLADGLANADHLAEALDARVAKAVNCLGRLEEAVANARFVVTGNAKVEPHVAKAAPALEDQCHKVAATMQGVLDAVDQTCVQRHGLRASVSIAQLQAESVCRFAADTIDGREDPATSSAATQALVQALENGIDSMHTSLDDDRDQARHMSAQIKATESTLKVTTLLLRKWRSLIEKSDIRHEMEALLPVLDDALAGLVDELAGLHDTAEAFAGGVVAFESAELQRSLDTILSLNTVAA
ncbi:PAS domain-containing protein [Novosphingobium mangrovi (ex Hu et al. 2023)]|uniref:PAS domain-containing protein n=1 Tax=Novosphingobium mangrovi (ex Hu et al. 2023) TaxID=2930094 RepID=A0ABT0AFP7_9SPHN|nr:PAS domain-containing protein [Novosphingobium mangrovi (ex Hu et al. 2023)]MCJ1962025.1 PAS domain-containing protein [Novosphingobium mangrovi (ex Hu et al. 2023)]